MLIEEAQSVGRRFNAVVEHYPATSDWTWDHAFEETKKDIAMLTDHLKKEEIVESNVPDPESVSTEMETAAAQRKEIGSSVDNVLMIHVDEAGFKEGLVKIAKTLNEHAAFCRNSYYPLLREHLGEKRLQKIGDQLEFSCPG
jgi:hypothetical protein